MTMHDDALRKLDSRIAWLLAYPGTSQWLKAALSGALAGDPIEVGNDLEILDSVLRARCRVMVETALPGPMTDQAEPDGLAARP